jgi:hypothetical protein
VADLARLGEAYRQHALTNPHLYRVMFGGHTIGEYAPTDEDRAHGLDTFLSLVAAIQRCIDAGRYTTPDAVAAAVQVWVAQHGAVTLELADFLAAMTDVQELYRNIYVGLSVALGDDPKAAARSFAQAAGLPA